jgi:putative addiction module killer protein
MKNSFGFILILHVTAFPKTKIGPGYRVYFGEHDDLLIILGAGTKKTQQADIALARKRWREYNS